MSKTKYLITLFVLFPILTQAGYTIDKSSDFYSEIYNSQSSLKSNYKRVSLLGGDTKANLVDILNNWITLNSKTFPEKTLTGSMNIDDFTQISNGNVKVLNNYILSGSLITEAQRISIVNYFKSYKDYKSDQANRTVNTITSIGKIGIYADGDTSNSPFDIIADLKEIDKIIFEREEYLPYNGVNIDYKKGLEYLASGVKPSNIANKINTSSGIDQALINAINQNQNSNINMSGFLNLNNENCVDNNSSGLNSGVIEQILNPENAINNSMSGSLTGNNSGDETNNTTTDTNSSYKKVDDSGIWPCNDYFCITFNTQKATQQLFGGFTLKFPAIDTLFKKSNSHLEKAVNSSLAQSKMTTNNFELSFSNVDLASMFNAGIFVSNKPNPIVDKSNNKEVKGDYEVIKMLEESYKAYGMDYSRQNDLSIFDGESTSRYLTQTSKELSVGQMLEKKSGYDVVKDKNSIKIIALNKGVDSEMTKQDMKVMSTNFTEVEGYVEYLMEYAFQLYSIVKSMDKIPSN